MITNKSLTERWWDITELDVPQRSTLYNLEPVGIGTSHVESLTGYVQRLAYAHCLSTWMLVSRKISSAIEKEYLSKDWEQNLGVFFSKGNMLNGTGSVAQDWVQALESLTGRNDLRFLTLLSFAEILPLRELFRKTRAWCPHCYADWSLSERQPYEPLLWTLNVVTVCVNHGEALDSTCHKCDRTLSPLSRRAALDHCDNCGEWLGIKHTPNDQEGGFSEDVQRQQAWITENLGELLIAAPTLKMLPRVELVARNLTDLTKYITSGNRSRFARELQMTNTSLVQRACSGQEALGLKNLLSIECSTNQRCNIRF